MSSKKTLTMEFPEGPEGEMEVRRVLSANAAYSILWDIGQEIFRPARKHGYPDPEVQQLMDAVGEPAVELVGKLEEMYRRLLEEGRVSLEDWH